MQLINGFPRELLNSSVQERTAFFENYTMPHPRLIESVKQLTDSIYESAKPPIVFVFGPTGVGKSTLIRKVRKNLIESALPDLFEDRARIPCAVIEAATPEFSNFDWKDFYVRGLTALQEPLIDNKVDPDSAKKKPNPDKNKLKLRLSFEEALRQRHPDAFFIDEAQNLGKLSSGRKLKDQTDCIKSIANISGVQFVLVGTYELIVLRNLSAQLCRRSIDVHFSRYQSTPEDLKIFENIVKTFQYYLPLPEIPDLASHWDFCYERTIGCVGILKDWLSRTLSAVLKTNPSAKTITYKDLMKHAWSVEQCRIMLTEAMEAEGKFRDKDAGKNDLRMALGLVASQASTSQVTSQSDTATPQGKGKTRNVGKPNPTRRPTGERNDS
ncbi:AAA family ATPase [Phormidium tenue FACHB-886]|nr:AAA family ATPase [Phormidium tenue FACHB-886]